jgi:threonine dehydrogenase-like Zn-dependent dehydrogenase
MRAMTVVPGEPGTAALNELPDPVGETDGLLVRGLLVGVCGTDREIADGVYGEAPAGRAELIVGHEGLGEVLEAPAGSGFEPGDLVVGIVRRPDPVPCPACAAGEWDMCRNERFSERGIVRMDGYGSERWRLEPEFAIAIPAELGELGVLLEPASVLAKAWEQTERIFTRSSWRPAVALITGAGPIGLFAALLGAQRGLEVHVLDRDDTGPKAQLVADLGATFHTGDVTAIGVTPDVVIECTGHGPLVFELADVVAPDAVICLTGISSGTRTVTVGLDEINKEIVLENTVLFGSVNASRRNYEQAATALAAADRGWLQRLITRRVPMSEFAEALHKRDDDVKVVVDLQT